MTPPPPSPRDRPGASGEPFLPPGRTETVLADRVLVLAPHPDDEVLGCGGLVAELAAGGAAVRVLFLSDGSRLDEAGHSDPESAAARDYAARRAAEAEAALGELGAGLAGRLDLPDGALASRAPELEEGIRRALAREKPDLLLVPSPLEVTADHRAAFAALHAVLAPLGRRRTGRGDESAVEAQLETVARGLRVLLYEVNHPLHPDLLVDVSERLPVLERAMEHHRSQQDRHDYLAAGLGLRRWRTLSLPAGVEAAEAYRRLALEDFTTRSPRQLVEHLGGPASVSSSGAEGPRISVVVRTRDRPALLREALASLAASTLRPAEVVVVNDGGAPPELPEDGPLTLVRREFDTSRGRAAALEAGVEAATGEWIAFLDDDDVVAPEHLATLAGAAVGSGARVVYTDAAVVVLELGAGGWEERERRLPYSRDFDPDVLALDNYIPFHTVLVERALVDELAAEGPVFDHGLPIFEDWDFLLRLARKAPFHHVRRVTCEYRHYRGAGHHALGERARERADFLEVKARVLAKHRELLGPERLGRAVDALRREAVEVGEELAAARRTAADETRRRRELERQALAADAEAARLVRDLEAARAAVAERGEALERLFADEKALRATVEDQGEHLERTYAEIGRLNRILDDLRAASAWGLLSWWRRERREASPGEAGDDGGGGDGGFAP